MTADDRSESAGDADTGVPEDRASAAERVAEEWAERAGRWALGVAARAREEAEDIWAEAQVLRRKG